MIRNHALVAVTILGLLGCRNDPGITEPISATTLSARATFLTTSTAELIAGSSSSKLSFASLRFRQHVLEPVFPSSERWTLLGWRFNVGIGSLVEVSVDDLRRPGHSLMHLAVKQAADGIDIILAHRVVPLTPESQRHAVELVAAEVRDLEVSVLSRKILSETEGPSATAVSSSWLDQDYDRVHIHQPRDETSVAGIVSWNGEFTCAIADRKMHGTADDGDRVFDVSEEVASRTQAGFPSWPEPAWAVSCSAR